MTQISDTEGSEMTFLRNKDFLHTLLEIRYNMKAFVIFGVVLCFAVVALSRKPDPVLQPYPTVFTAVYNESDRATPWQAPRMTSISLDLPNKRAAASFPGSNGAPESWILIYQPKGGDPKAPASQGYTAFNINPDYPSQVPFGCYYTTGNLMGLSPFPPHWNVQQDPYNQQVDTWYNLPSDLEYAGQYFIEELGVMSDRWDSVSQCLLEKTGIGQVPCASAMYSQGANPLPLMDIRAFGARKNSFENDRYAVRVYHKFITSVDDSAFELPNNWQVNCGNADNAFVTDPTAISVFNTGGSDSTLKVKLATPPVAALGNVKVYMVPSPTWYYNCVDCVMFSPTVLTFTQDNWNTTQSWPVKYNSEGCSQFVIRATGGGYDWSYYGTTITTYACVGSNFSGCSATPTCGNSDSFILN